LRALSRERKITWVEPHYLYALQQNATQPTPAPDKPPRSYSSALLHLTEAHQLATGKGVRVAVIDSLIDVDHPEILGSVAARFDALEGSGARPQLHGTGMASAIAGHGQLDGAAPDARILAVQAFGETDAGVRAAGLDILAGVDWAAAQKAQVINMSFAGPLDPLLSLMLAAAAEKRIALIAAAGNEGPLAQPQYPAADPHVIAVSAVDAQARVYAKANRGPYVALAAPGVDVLVAAPGGAYDLSTGTSVACAEVSGIAALLLEKKPDLDGAELRRLLQKSARPFDGVSDSGAGAANAETAVAGVR
jgi:subtilisin family serine protease